MKLPALIVEKNSNIMWGNKLVSLGGKMIIKEIKIEDLKPYGNNPKKHPQEQIDKIIESIHEFGFVMPLLIDKENNIISGHGRHEAAKQIDKPTVPCIINDELTEEQKKAYRIADNKLAESEYDYEKLGQEFIALKEIGFKIELTGFKIDEADTIMNNMDIDDFFEDSEDVEQKEKEKFITCPKCGERINISEYI